MPPLPGADLILVHSDLAFASFEARFNTGARLDDPCQFPQRRFLKRRLSLTGRREVIMVAMLGVLIGGIARGAGLQGTVVRERSPGDHQPLFGSRSLPFEPRLHAAPDHLDLHRPFLAVAYRQVGPRIARE